MAVAVMDFELEYTTPESRGACGFCGKEENGYAKRDEKGNWKACCWKCIKPDVIPPDPVRRKVGTVHEEPVESAEPVDTPRTRRKLNAAEVIEMYNGGRGKKILDIATAFGYPEGEGYSAIRAILKKAGVFKKFLQ